MPRPSQLTDAVPILAVTPPSRGFEGRGVQVGRASKAALGLPFSRARFESPLDEPVDPAGDIAENPQAGLINLDEDRPNGATGDSAEACLSSTKPPGDQDKGRAAAKAARNTRKGV